MLRIEGLRCRRGDLIDPEVLSDRFMPPTIHGVTSVDLRDDDCYGDEETVAMKPCLDSSTARSAPQKSGPCRFMHHGKDDRKQP